MTRSWYIYASPVAFAAGLFLAHCSSSSSGGTTGSSSSATNHGSSSSNESSSSSTSTSTSSSKSTTSSSSSSSVATSSSSSGSGGGDDAGSAQATAAHAGDQAATCTPPAGGDTCSPGSVSCGGTPCAVPANQCCDPSGGGAETCAAPGTSCAGTIITCNEAADCAADEVCCIASQTTTSGVVSCQKLVGGACPTAPIATAQICRSSAECPTGNKCQFWNCLGNVIEACSNPVPSLAVCTVQVEDAGSGGSGSGS